MATEIDQEESDSEGEDLPGDIIPCDNHPRCAYYTGHSSIYETVETELYVISVQQKKNVYFRCYAKGNHRRNMKHITVDNT